MKDKFNLSEKREELLNKILKIEDKESHIAIRGLFLQIEEQDEEFIKRLTKFTTIHACADENNKDPDLECNCYNKRMPDQNCWVIPKIKFNKLAGDKFSVND